MKKVIIMLFAILLLTGCGSDNRKCIKSHTEESTCLKCQPFYTGKSMSCIWLRKKCNKTICDEYEGE